MSYLCLFADPDIGLSASHIYHVVQNACWREYKTADELHVLLASAICKFIAKCICLNCKMYLFKLQNVFVQIAKCICSNYIVYLSKLQSVFVQIEKCISSNCKVYLFSYTYHAC